MDFTSNEKFNTEELYNFEDILGFQGPLDVWLAAHSAQLTTQLMTNRQRENHQTMTPEQIEQLEHARYARRQLLESQIVGGFYTIVTPEELVLMHALFPDNYGPEQGCKVGEMSPPGRLLYLRTAWTGLITSAPGTPDAHLAGLVSTVEQMILLGPRDMVDLLRGLLRKVLCRVVRERNPGSEMLKNVVLALLPNTAFAPQLFQDAIKMARRSGVTDADVLLIVSQARRMQNYYAERMIPQVDANMTDALTRSYYDVQLFTFVSVDDAVEAKPAQNDLGEHMCLHFGSAKCLCQHTVSKAGELCEVCTHKWCHLDPLA